MTDDMPTQEILRDIYPEVDEFANRMREELWNNREHGDAVSWRAMSPRDIYFEIAWHTGKLVQPIRGDVRDAMREHAADIANSAMFLFDHANHADKIDTEALVS